MKKIHFLPLLLLVLLFGYYNVFSQVLFHNVTIRLDNKFTLQDIYTLGIELDHGARYENSSMHCIINDAILDSLKNRNVEVKINQYDVASFYANRIAEEKSNNIIFSPLDSKKVYGSMGNFLTLEEIYAIFAELETKYPSYIRRDSIGVTFEGRPIYAFHIGEDSIKNSTDLPRTLITSVHHAREAITPTLTCYFAQDFFEKLENQDSFCTYILKHSPITIIPCLNPDGYEYNRLNYPNGGGMWRKNRRIIPNAKGIGVDPNRNYGPKQFWDAPNNGSSTESTAETYRGDSAFSEAETKAVKNLIETYNFKTALNFHSAGDLIVTPIGYTNSNPLDSVPYHYFNSSLTNENKFPFSICLQSYGYETRGCANDYMYIGTNKKILSITPEIGNQREGFWPQKERILPLVLVNLSSMYSALKSTIAIPFIYSYTIEYKSANFTDFTLTFANPSLQKSVPCELVYSSLNESNNVKLMSKVDDLPSINDSETITKTISLDISVVNTDSLFIEGIVIQRKFENFSLFDTLYFPLHQKEESVLFNGEVQPVINKMQGWFLEYDSLKGTTYLTESFNSKTPNKARLDAISKDYFSLVGCIDAYLEFESNWDFEVVGDGTSLFFKEIDSTRIKYLQSERMQKVAIYNHGSFLLGTPILTGHFSQRITQRASLKNFINKIGQIGFQARTDDNSSYNGFNLYTAKIIKYFPTKNETETEREKVVIREINNQIQFTFSLPQIPIISNIQFFIHNIRGQQVYFCEYEPLKYQYRNINLSKDIFPSGSYYVSYIFDGKTIQEPFTVVR